MKSTPELSGTFIESELNRIAKGRTLADFIDGVSQGIEEKIASTTLPPKAEQFPCPCCKGAGWLYTASDLYSLDIKTGKLEAITRKSGGAVRMGGSVPCPRCFGAQFDMVAWVQSQLAGQGVAA
ncbi:hypothetical protein [uncultured Microbulbifer sp.]|uniref:hypothetical protein n=1 Tax=uncultured Microbulbifer sp. TaxID=348147 RepID=UPI0025CFEA35|nr:hypothetical protein [uncultured Microbulbifer sp.]